MIKYKTAQMGGFVLPVKYFLAILLQYLTSFCAISSGGYPPALTLQVSCKFDGVRKSIVYSVRD